MNRITLGHRTFDKRNQLGNDRQIIAIDGDKQAAGISGCKVAGIDRAGTISDGPNWVCGSVVVLNNDIRIIEGI